VSNIANVVGAVIGLAAINRLLDRTDKVTPAAAPKPLIKQGFVTGPAAGVQDFTLIKPMTQITPKQLEAFTPDRPVTRPVYDPKAMIAQPIAKGKVIPLGFRQGETADDLIRRIYGNK
jgi:hypothetical protein